MTIAIDELGACHGEDIDWKLTSPVVPKSDDVNDFTSGYQSDSEVGNGRLLDELLPQLLFDLAGHLRRLTEVQSVFGWLYQRDRRPIRLQLQMAEVPASLQWGMDLPLDDAIAGWIWQHQRPLVIASESESRFPGYAEMLLDCGIKSFCAVPLMIENRRVGIFGLASTKSGAFQNFNEEFPWRCRLEIDDNSGDGELNLDEDALSEDEFEGIIGHGPSIRRLQKAVKMVAPTNSTVLVLGETGTGKELIARAIHNLSSRRDRPFIKVNCASIPKELYESEFFGHVRGAFTGAIKDRVGRFEAANGGTLFLDEIGEVPLELQSKLLRALQEKQYERVGDERTRRVDVRIIAATNRNLKHEVEAGRFRDDLYYRLNVFPVEAAPLRERMEDIPFLAKHFVTMLATELRCPKPRLTEAGVARLQGYDWPGNVRELRNVIERATIVARGKALEFDLPIANNLPVGVPPIVQNGSSVDPEFFTEIEFQRRERENLRVVLQKTQWKIRGANGAAELLGVKPTTLISRIKKMGLKR